MMVRSSGMYGRPVLEAVKRDAFKNIRQWSQLQPKDLVYIVVYTESFPEYKYTGPQ